MHIHLSVDDIARAIGFYSTLFDQQPSMQKSDYAEWSLKDTSVNFAISTQRHEKGLYSLGIQVDEDSELIELRDRLKNAKLNLFDEGKTICCYAHSDLSWVEDPAGIPWMAFRAMANAESD